jgi:hypothetical protein
MSCVYLDKGRTKGAVFYDLFISSARTKRNGFIWIMLKEWNHEFTPKNNLESKQNYNEGQTAQANSALNVDFSA